MRRASPFVVLSALLQLSLLTEAPAENKGARYELRGRVLTSKGRPLRGTTPAIRLEGTRFPFLRRTLVKRDGTFKFKKIPATTYQLTISATGWGEMRRTIEVGPSKADRKHRIEMNFLFEPDRRVDSMSTVSTKQLSVAREASKEYSKALKRLEKEDSAGAIKHLERAVEISPHFSAAWNHLGTIAYMSRQPSRARNCFKQAVEHDPDSYAALVNLGAALLALGILDEAIKVNSRAVGLRGDEPLARSQLGLTYLKLGRLDEAEKELKLAKQLAPEHFSSPQLTLAEIYHRRDDFAAVASEIKEYLRYHPDSPAAPRLTLQLQAARDRIRRDGAKQSPNPPPGAEPLTPGQGSTRSSDRSE